MHLSWALLAAVLLVCFVVAGESRQESISVDSVSDRLIPLGRPFACVNGSLSLDLTLQRDNVEEREESFVVAVFGWEVWQAIRGQRRYFNSLCVAPAKLRFEVRRTLQLREVPVLNLRGDLEKYQAVIINCGDDEISATGDIKWTGENGEPLSFEELPMLPLYLVLTIMYMVSSLLWIGYLKFVARPGVIYVIEFLCILIFRTPAYALYHLHYRIDNNTSGLFILWCIQALCELAAEMAILTIVLNIAFGWDITCGFLSRRQRLFYWGSWLSCFFLAMLHFLCPSSSSLCLASLTTWLVARSIAGLVATLSANVIRVMQHASYFESAASLPPFPHTRLELLRKLAWFLLLFIPVPVAAVLLEFILGWKNAWLSRTLEPFVALALVNGLGYILVRHPLYLNFRNEPARGERHGEEDNEGRANSSDDTNELDSLVRRRRRRATTSSNSDEEGQEMVEFRPSTNGPEARASDDSSQFEEEQEEEEEGLIRKASHRPSNPDHEPEDKGKERLLEPDEEEVDRQGS